MSWAPTTDFENEIVSLQPDHDFIFGTLADTEPDVYYPRPQSHLVFIQEKKTRKQNQARQCGSANSDSNSSSKLSIISKVQRIAGTKPLGEQPTIEDWDNEDNVEYETIALMRHLGLNPSIEEPLDEGRTITTLPIMEEMHVMHNGMKRMPIFFHDKFFKLKPRVENTSLGGITVLTVDDVVENLMENTGIDINSSQSTPEVSESSKVELSSYATGNSVSFKDIVEKESYEDDSYVTANSYDYIPTRSWYRSGRRNNSANSQSSSSNSSFQNRHKKNYRFFTAKELYDKRRQH